MWGSIGYLLFVLLDFVTGYLASRKFLVQGGITIFDRYYHDLLIDPKRYRYTGPMWFARLISYFIPPRDILFVVLDANPELILSRKQQLTLGEIGRQRKAYRTFALECKFSVLICTEDSLDACVTRTLSGVLAYLSQRLQRQYPQWFQSDPTYGNAS